MAFATSNVQTNYFGSLKVTYGDWSGSVGDAEGTLTVEGGRVYLAEFYAAVADGTTYQPAIQINTSTSGAVTTVTVDNQTAVTNGRFLIIHA